VNVKSFFGIYVEAFLLKLKYLRDVMYVSEWMHVLV
jgi:hypothetical protein